MSSRPLPRVSVILPVGAEAGIDESTIKCLLSQSLPDFELIVVIDGANQSVEGQLRAALPPAWTTILTIEKAVGVAGARNLALTIAAAPWVWFVDSDDTFSSEILERMVGAGESDPRIDLVVVGFQERIDAAHSQDVQVHLPPEWNGIAHRSDLAAAVRRRELQGHLWNKLFRREVLGDAPFPLLRSKSDLGGFLGVLSRIDGAVSVSEVLYTYYVRWGSITNARRRTPMDLIRCLGIAESSSIAVAGSSSEHAEWSQYRYEGLIFTALGELWRDWANDSSSRECEASIRRLCSVLDVPNLLRYGYAGTALRLSAVVVAPLVTRSLFRLSRRRRWSAIGRSRPSMARLR